MPLPYKRGSHGPEIEYWQAWFKREYRAYAPPQDGSYGKDEVAAVKEMQRRLGLPQSGEFDTTTASRVGYVPPTPGLRPIMFTVEGHSSNMFAGPVADTGTQLEAEGLCHHQPIGYNNGPIPFDNASGVNELARLIGSEVMDNLVPFPKGTPWSLGGFSQGGIVISDFYFDYLAPGKPLDWRTPELKGVLAYGNPGRKTDSIADWARPWITHAGSHGLDPIRRFGLPGCPDKPDIWVDVYREGDIFAENTDDKSSEVKAAVYQAVARSDFFSNPFSLAAQIAILFGEPVEEVLAIVTAIVSGVAFLGDQPNPHYSPYDISGGVAWMRDRLRS
ncbi:peptidoglycan-binding domain-containing protein [Mycobacterium sp. 852002-50816_SCH5313054-b]|uniref:peptidoglycan-binding domain-containing protein n=1 Tax=Mycobacterium sp. 852002-50816_SCH5313054-b TaxID=1834092 RepID=UPI0009ED9D47|nr:peptidoglycan-binding domain-containing protein [Mycobacterium sp. 852002-50816_SCH5313054-b]